MMTFLIVAGLMVLGCIAWLLPTVLSPVRVTQDSGPSHDEHALASYTERLDAVEQEHADGALSDAQLEEARRELARELLQDTRPEPARGGLSVAVGSWVGSAVILLAVPALAIATYMSLGSVNSLGLTGAIAAAGAPAAAPGTAAASSGRSNEGMPSIEEMVSGLAQRLQDNPDDAQGWLMLGRSYMVLDRLEDAQAAYAKAYALDAGRADILTGYAEALARNNNNSLAGRPQELLQSALALSPTDAKTLWLSGISAMQRGDRAAAITHWEALKATEALNAEETASLDRMIAEARGDVPASITRPGPAASTPVQPAQPAQSAVPQTVQATPGVSVTVTVSLAPDIAQSVRPGDTLFVFARAEQGPPMPLAVARMPVPQFPVTVRLDESMAMMPQMTLATFPRIYIGARISRSGNAQASPGDLQGRSEGLAPADTDAVSVEITEVVGG